MSEKLDNEEFKIVGEEGNAITGDSNKIKLKITSFAVIMEVQDAYIQKEIEEKKNKQQELEEQVASGTLEGKELKTAKKDLSLLKKEVRSLEDAYRKFSEARQRFLTIAKKALKLPKENFEQLAKEGWIELEDEKGKKEIIDLQDLSAAQEDVQSAITDEKDNDIFSSVDSNLIKEEVEKMMNSNITSSKKYGDTVARTIDADNFDETVNDITVDVKNEVDERKANEVTPDLMKDLFSSQEETKTDKSTSDEPEQSESEKDEINDSYTIDFDVPPISGEMGEWTTQPTTDDNKSFTGFDNDKSIESFIKGLKDRNESLKAHGEELNSQLSDVKDERKNATKKHEQAIKERDDAKRRAEEAQKQIELLNTYKPQMDQLRKANEEQEKLNRNKEAELQKENEALAEINTKTTALETEASAYDEETSKALEELKRLRAEFSGTGYSSSEDSPLLGGEGGRTR